ncbi:hypothetical protein CENSYa_1106 [Cenarchaeum symbiosum A]|uniref:Uncharacterized protein n=1 Tax=Cenarchaeum symbiosum (strain A) TaxID=414004 RepID=A0RWL8_CENSY|nr:hypothetical protein CENSYa_1106 [Cenarchaeum symbiosum A]
MDHIFDKKGARDRPSEPGPVAGRAPDAQVGEKRHMQRIRAGWNQYGHDILHMRGGQAQGRNIKGNGPGCRRAKAHVFKDPKVDSAGAKSFLAVETERRGNRIQMSGAAILVRDESGERHRVFEGDGMMDGISRFARDSTIYYWSRRALALAESSGGRMPRMQNLMDVYAESVTFHLSLLDPGSISREIGHPVENSVLGDCMALRNIHDWLVSVGGSWRS